MPVHCLSKHHLPELLRAQTDGKLMSTSENRPTLYYNRLDWACKEHLADDEAQSSAKELIRPRGHHVVTSMPLSICDGGLYRFGGGNELLGLCQASCSLAQRTSLLRYGQLRTQSLASL
jgi:hypothetical protein